MNLCVKSFSVCTELRLVRIFHFDKFGFFAYLKDVRIRMYAYYYYYYYCWCYNESVYYL